MFSKVKQALAAFREQHVGELVTADTLNQQWQNVTGECKFVHDGGRFTKLKHEGQVVAILVCEGSHAVTEAITPDGEAVLVILKRKNGQGL